MALEQTAGSVMCRRLSSVLRFCNIQGWPVDNARRPGAERRRVSQFVFVRVKTKGSHVRMVAGQCLTVPPGGACVVRQAGRMRRLSMLIDGVFLQPKALTLQRRPVRGCPHQMSRLSARGQTVQHTFCVLPVIGSRQSEEGGRPQ